MCGGCRQGSLRARGLREVDGLYSLCVCDLVLLCYVVFVCNV